MAYSKQKKVDVTTSYEKWLSESQAVYVLEYVGMTMKEVDGFRAKARENGSEIHLVKNTLFSQALSKQGYPEPDFLEGTSLVGFAYSDAAALAKTFTEFTKGNDTRKVKGGFLGKELITDKQVKALSDLPSLPMMRAMLLGVISAPASKLVRTLAEPGRSLAGVVQAYADKAATAA